MTFICPCADSILEVAYWEETIRNVQHSAYVIFIFPFLFFLVQLFGYMYIIFIQIEYPYNYLLILSSKIYIFRIPLETSCLLAFK